MTPSHESLCCAEYKLYEYDDVDSREFLLFKICREINRYLRTDGHEAKKRAVLVRSDEYEEDPRRKHHDTHNIVRYHALCTIIHAAPDRIRFERPIRSIPDPPPPADAPWV